MKSLFALSLASLCIAAVQAGETEIRQAIEQGSPGTRITSVGKSPIAGLYEVATSGAQGPAVLYVDEKGEFVIVGDLIDLKARRNMTRERMDELTKVKWEELPLANAVKVVRGDGSRKLAVFSDPDCPYCKKAEQELIKLNNITVYTFMFPLQMHPDAARKSKQVWCSKDRSQAWMDMMLKGKAPTAKDNCDNPLEANLALGNKLGVSGTPAIFFESGKRLPGYAPSEKLEAMLVTETQKLKNVTR
jgi:thiol:disulfide interchange protein DsbC